MIICIRNQRRVLCIISIVLVSLFIFACQDRPSSNYLQSNLDALRRTQRTSSALPRAQRNSVIAAAYTDLFGIIRDQDLAGQISDHDEDVMFSAAWLTATLTLEKSHVQDMTLLLMNLQRRGVASREHYVHMYEMYVGMRMFTEARQLAKQHFFPEMETLPELNGSTILIPGQPTELELSLGKRELTRRSVDLAQSQVIVIAHPLCHFSRAVARAIQEDPVLAESFGSHARWLAPQDTHIEFDVIQQWNEAHTEQRTSIAFQESEWPMVDSWSTPTFYFLEGGHVVAKVEGWPKEGHRAELIAGLQKAGLLHRKSSDLGR